MNKLTLLSTVAILSLPSAVLAQGAENWQGFYIGGAVNNSDASFSVTPTFDTSGMNLSLIAGYNHAINEHFIVGAEINFSIGEYVEPQTLGFPGIEDVTTLRVRAGYAMDDFMFYIGAGSMRGDLVIPGISQGIDGVQTFVGIEMAVSENMNARMEYSSVSMDTPLYGPTADVDVRTISLGLTFNF